MLSSHPADFTPVCTTELGAVAKLKPEFDRRNVKVLALSVDDVKSHKGWIGDIEETQSTQLNYPILADPDREISDLYLKPWHKVTVCVKRRAVKLHFVEAIK